MPGAGHALVTGSTGRGKSKLIQYMILKSFELDRPCMYIDPKGDTYPSIVANFFKTEYGKKMWEKYKHRIIFINPTTKSNYIVGFNAMQPIDGFPHADVDRTAFVANALTSHITRSTGFEPNEAMRMQTIASAAIGLMVEGGHGELTLAELPLLFRPYKEGGQPWPFNPMATELLKSINHFGTELFWRDMWAMWTVNDRKSWAQSTLGRIQPFLFDQKILMTTCTSSNSSLDFNDIVNKGYWVFVNLDFNLLSESVTTFAGSLIFNKVFNASMNRDENCEDYRIIIDEARLLNTAPFERVYNTGGKFKTWLTLLVQDLNQLYRPTSSGRDYHLRDVALNDSQYIYAFQNNVTSSEMLSDIMFPTTGRLIRGTRESGDPDYLPTDAERALYIQRFTSLPKQMMIMYDRDNPYKTKPVWAPTLEYPDATQSEINYFEAKHLQVIGRSASEILREIWDRRRKWESVLNLVDPEMFIGSVPRPPVPVYEEAVM